MTTNIMYYPNVILACAENATNVHDKSATRLTINLSKVKNSQINIVEILNNKEPSFEVAYNNELDEIESKYVEAMRSDIYYLYNGTYPTNTTEYFNNTIKQKCFEIRLKVTEYGDIGTVKQYYIQPYGYGYEYDYRKYPLSREILMSIHT